MKGDDSARAAALIGDDDLEFVPVHRGPEQIELKRCFVLAPDLLANENEAVRGSPGLGFPPGLEEAEFTVQATPSLPALDHPLELSEPLEGNRDGEFGARVIQFLGDGFVKKRAVDAGLDFDPGQRRAHALQAVGDKGIGPIGVVDIAGPVVHIQDLICLGDRTEERIVAACPFLLLVEAHCRSLGMAARAQHGTVEVQRDSCQPFPRQTFDHQVSRYGPDFLDADLVRAAQRAADRGGIRQTLEAKQSFDHLVVTIVVDIPQSPVSDNQMHNQQHQHDMVAVDRAHLEVEKTAPQSFLDADQGEEVLKENQAGVGSQILWFESNLQGGSCFTSNRCLAMFHISGLSVIGVSFWSTYIVPIR